MQALGMKLIASRNVESWAWQELGTADHLDSWLHTCCWLHCFKTHFNLSCTDPLDCNRLKSNKDLFCLHIGQSVPGVCVTYTSPPSRTPVQKVGLCKWCKKSKVLQSFSSSDGEKEISCNGLCSALCFEQAVKNIKENQAHVNETQQVLHSRPLPPTGSNGE